MRKHAAYWFYTDSLFCIIGCAQYGTVRYSIYSMCRSYGMYSMNAMYRVYGRVCTLVRYVRTQVRMYVRTQHQYQIYQIYTQNNIKYERIFTEAVTFQKKGLSLKDKTPAASLKRRKQRMEGTNPYKNAIYIINIKHSTLLVLNMVLYINCIALSIDPFLGPCY